MSGRHTRGAARFGNWTSLAEGLAAFGARLDQTHAENMARLGQEERGGTWTTPSIVRAVAAGTDPTIADLPVADQR